MPRAAFILPDDVTTAPGFYRSLYDIDMGNPDRGQQWLEFLTAASLIIFLVVIGYVLVWGVVRLIRRQQTAATLWTSCLTPIIAGLTAAAGWVALLLISDINSHFSRSDRLLLHFGLPLEYPPALATAILVPVYLFLTGGLVILTALAWRRRERPVGKLVLFTLTAVAALGYAGLMMRWDLHTLLF